MSDATLPDAIPTEPDATPPKRVSDPEPASSLGLKKLGGNIGLMLFTQVSTTVLSLGITIVFARSLGRSGYGIQSLAYIVPTMMATLFNLGISPANSYFLGSKQVTPKAALRATFFLSSLLSIAGVLIGVPIIYFLAWKILPGVPLPYLWWMVALGPITLMQMSLASIFLGVQNFKPFNVSAILIPAATLTSALILVVNYDLGVPGALISYGVGQIVSLLVTLYYLRPYARGDEPPVPIAHYAVQCVSYGYKAHLTNIFGYVNYRIDTILVTMFLVPKLGGEAGLAVVGIYVLAVTIAEKLWIIAQAASQVAMPKLAELNSDQATQSRLTPIVGRWVLFTTFAGSLAFALVGPIAIDLFYGSKYANVYPLLLWLLPGAILLSVSKVLANDIFARGMVLLNLYLGIAMLVVNILVNTALIPIWGAAGAAIASTIGYLVDTAVRLGIYSKVSGNHWWAPIVPRREDWVLFVKGANFVHNLMLTDEYRALTEEERALY